MHFLDFSLMTALATEVLATSFYGVQNKDHEQCLTGMRAQLRFAEGNSKGIRNLAQKSQK